jgi:hypothetical protein
MKVRICTATTALLLALATPQAQAACEPEDLRGRWDVYEIADLFGFTATHDCIFVVNRHGEFGRARSFCGVRTSGVPELRTTTQGTLSIRRSCAFSGEFGTCVLDGTMTKSKEMISGTAVCDGDSLVMLFSMVKR